MGTPSPITGDHSDEQDINTTAIAEHSPAIEFQDVFSLRRPKDIKAGLASGGKSIVKGLGAGVVGLVAAPALGAHQEGFVGFAKGAAAGCAGVVLLPVTGLVIGSIQIGRGFINQPVAIREARKGKFWDLEKREWVDQPTLALVLDDEMFQPARQAWHAEYRSAGGAGPGPSAGIGSGENYYELLGVPPDSSLEAIKRQYYILARRLHPDKNPGDEGAKDKFQKLGEAYQVLSNPELRARYDQHGEEGLDVNFMDGAEFFTMLFGCDRFEHLVGELMLATLARVGDKASPPQLEKVRAVREERLAALLKAYLRRWTEGDHHGFQDMMRGEAASLAQASFGPTMLETIGRMYTMQADILLGGFIEGGIKAWQQRGHTMKTALRATGLAIKVFNAQQRIEKFERDYAKSTELIAARQTVNMEAQAPGHPDQPSEPAPSQPGPSVEHLAERQRMEEAAMPLMLDAMWAANVLDIEGTLRSVCKKVLHDRTVNKQMLKDRAQALRILGHIFSHASSVAQGSDNLQSEPDAKQRMEDAIQRMMDKKNAADERAYGPSSASAS
ncbi:hypothetical protein WJX84_008412 [Apatococcus fuscideae]|uniref:J domain-containing protein n=1 Tax=Apatococcus fuscideae TaxID=2026836 RepID=A0AAW1T9K9_9CHLO